MAFYATTEVKDEKRYYPVFRCDKSENRMIGASNGSTYVTYKYDYMGRMFEKVSGSVTNSYVWDGYNIIAEISPAQTNYNVWGLDLSQSLQGAGGVGGLLAVVENTGSGTETYYATYDGNGNVTDYVDEDGVVQAHYEYRPFGGITVASESKADDFTHRFSTKPYDGDTGLVEYEFRKYIADLARWGSRDPLEEKMGLLLYSFVENRAVNMYDSDGLRANGNPNMKAGCNCGPDNTAGLTAALLEAELRFTYAGGGGAWSRWWNQLKGCATMFFSNRALDAWDLNFNYKGTEPCKNTITIDGECYYEWDVNYALWGKGANLCEFTLKRAKAQSWLYKMTIRVFANIIGGDWETITGGPDALFEWTPQVSGWSEYGYSLGAYPDPPKELKHCKPSSEEGIVTIDDWPWGDF